MHRMTRTNLETYKIWAPDDSPWTAWAKPVMFMRYPFQYINLSIPEEVDWISGIEEGTMLIVDLPGSASVAEGMALARMGYRPVPLYNGVDAGNGHLVTVNVSELADVLFGVADELETLPIGQGAPPVFLLDANRMSGVGKIGGMFDNRWCVFAQDMPSASYLRAQGINRVIVRSQHIRNDLAHILHRYKKEGIFIYRSTGNEPLKELSDAKPSRFRSLSYRFKTTLGLTRNAAGGFGARIPEPEQGGTGRGYRYYGHG